LAFVVVVIVVVCVDVMFCLRRNCTNEEKEFLYITLCILPQFFFAQISFTFYMLFQVVCVCAMLQSQVSKTQRRQHYFFVIAIAIAIAIAIVLLLL